MTETKKSDCLALFILILYILSVTAGVFIAGVWAYAGLGSGLILFTTLWIKDRKPPLPEKKIGILALASLAVMAAENLLSPTPDVAWHEWIKLVTIFLPLSVLTSPNLRARLLHRHFIMLLLIASVAGALALSVELSLGGPLLQVVKHDNALTHYNRGLSYLVMLAFPLMAGLFYSDLLISKKQRWFLVIPFIVILLIPAGLTESRAAKLALVLALITVIAAYLLPKMTRYGLMALPVICVAWPFAVQKFFLTHYDALSQLPYSWRARVEIWDYMSYRIMERPVFGWGLGTAHLLDYKEPHGNQYLFTTGPAAHPHNVMTQLWVELGIPGIILGLAFAFLTLRAATKLQKQYVPFALGAWVAALTLSLVAYGFWTDSLFSAFALTGLLFLMLNSENTNQVKEI